MTALTAANPADELAPAPGDAPGIAPGTAARPWPIRAIVALGRSAFTRIILATVLVTGAMAGTQYLARDLRMRQTDSFTFEAAAMHLIGAAAMVATVLVVYTLFVRCTERRAARELRAAPAFREIPLGFLGGVMLASTVVGTLALLGAYHVDAVAPRNAWVELLFRAAVSNLVVAVFEETIARGIILRITQQRLGSRWALAISALIFGLAHMFNPNATVLGALGLALQAGVLLGAVYLLTQRLWLAIGVHWAWNFMQQGVVGGALSGGETHAILTSHPAGPAWLSGGSFGIEGSIVATVLCGSVGFAILRYAAKRGTLIPRSWPMRVGA